MRAAEDPHEPSGLVGPLYRTARRVTGHELGAMTAYSDGKSPLGFARCACGWIGRGDVRAAIETAHDVHVAWIANRQPALTIGSICTGYGGIELGLELAGIEHKALWHSEICPDASAVLGHHWPDVPNVGDITKVDPKQIRSLVDHPGHR